MTRDLRGELRRCDEALAAHLAAAQRAFGAAALGVIDLPDLGSGSVEPAQIRAAAALYWLMELEEAGVLPFVEALSEAVVRGTWAGPLGAGARRLLEFWRDGSDQFSAHERLALFSRLFGTPGDPNPNSAFPDQLHRLTANLVAVGRDGSQGPPQHLVARTGITAHELASQLSGRAVGITAYAGREIVARLRKAVALLKDPDISRALGGGDPIQLVHRHAPNLLRRPVNPARHVARARAGRDILLWVAANAQVLQSGQVALRSNDPVISSAEQWRSHAGLP